MVCNLLVVVTYFYSNFVHQPGTGNSGNSSSRGGATTASSNPRTLLTFTDITTQSAYSEYGERHDVSTFEDLVVSNCPTVDVESEKQTIP